MFRSQITSSKTLPRTAKEATSAEGGNPLSQNNLLRSILESLDHPIYVIDAQDYTIKLSYTPACFGASCDDLTCYAFAHNRDAPCSGTEYRCPLEEIKKTRQPVTVEHIHYDRKGNRRAFEVHGYPIFDSQGNVSQIIEYILDITERRQAETELRESEARFRGIFEHTQSGVAVYEAVDDGEDFVIQDFNASGERIDNLHREDVIGKRITEVFPGVRDFGLLDVLRRVWRTGTSEEYPISKYEDERIEGWRENYVYRLPSGEVVAVYEDVTERKQAEESLRVSESQLSEGAKIAKLGYWEHDILNELFTFSDHFYEILRTTADEVGGYKMSCNQYFETYIHPDDRERVKAKCRDIFENPDSQSSNYLEHRIIYADGEIGYVAVRFTIVKDDQGRVIKTYGVNQDITERKQAEAALRESEEKFRLIADTCQEVIWQFDRNGCMIYVSPAVESIFGYTPVEAVGRTYNEFLANSESPRATEIFTQGISGKRYQSLEFIGKKKDGAEFPIEISVTPIFQEMEIVGIQGIALDITERKRADEKNHQYQQQLKSLVLQLTHAEEQEQKRIADVLHDGLAQSLVFLKLRTDLLAQEVGSTLEVQTLKEISQSLGELLEQTRNLSFELKSPILQTLGLGPAIEEWLTEKVAQQHGLEIHFEQDEILPPLPPKMQAMLFQMTRELLTNVVKHAGARRVAVSLQQADHGVELGVQDDGVGLDIQAEKEPAGQGLFSIEERLVSVGGHMAIRSEPGQGTQVTLHVPLEKSTIRKREKQ